MKQYDKIGIPPVEPAIRTPWVAAHGPFIVLTRDEAFDLWMAALDYCDSDIPPKSKKDFKTYLQSKGINI